MQTFYASLRTPNRNHSSQIPSQKQHSCSNDNKNIIDLLLKSINLQRSQLTNNKTSPTFIHQADCCY